MSQENVELLVGFFPGPDVDVVPLFRDDSLWPQFSEAITPLFHPDFASVHYVFGTERTYTGMGGFRAFWLDWLAPWVSYRIEIEQIVDCGDRVLVLVRDFGRRAGSPEEVKGSNGSVWTVYNKLVARVQLYIDHATALKAVGVEE